MHERNTPAEPQVTGCKQWKGVAEKFDFPKSITSGSFTLRTNYERFLKDYELRCEPTQPCNT